MTLSILFRLKIFRWRIVAFGSTKYTTCLFENVWSPSQLKCVSFRLNGSWRNSWAMHERFVPLGEGLEKLFAAFGTVCPETWQTRDRAQRGGVTA